MAVTAVSNQSFRLRNSFIEVLGSVHRQNRRELFMGEFFTDINRFNLADQDLCVFRYIHSGHLCDRISALSDDLRVQRAVDKNGLPNLFNLVFFKEIAPSVGKFFLYRIVDRIQNRHRLFGCADHTVVKCLRMDN